MYIQQIPPPETILYFIIELLFFVYTKHNTDYIYIITHPNPLNNCIIKRETENTLRCFVELCFEISPEHFTSRRLEFFIVVFDALLNNANSFVFVK